MDALACAGAVRCVMKGVPVEADPTDKVAEPRPGSNLVGPSVSNGGMETVSGFTGILGIV